MVSAADALGRHKSSWAFGPPRLRRPSRELQSNPRARQGKKLLTGADQRHCHFLHLRVNHCDPLVVLLLVATTNCVEEHRRK